MKKWKAGVVLICVLTLLFGFTTYAVENKSIMDYSTHRVFCGQAIVKNGELQENVKLPKGVVDFATDTLTLENYQADINLHEFGEWGAEFISAQNVEKSNFTLKLVGENKIKVRYDWESPMDIIRVDDLLIEGPGTLQIEASDFSGSTAIKYDRNLKIKGCELDIIRKADAEMYFYAISKEPWSGLGELVVENADVNIESSTTNNRVTNVGIDAQDGDMTVINSNINVKLHGGYSVFGIGVGLYKQGEVFGGKLTIKNSRIDCATTGGAKEYNMYFYDMNSIGDVYYYAGDIKADSQMSFDEVFEFGKYVSIPNRYDANYNYVTISPKLLGEFCDHKWNEGQVEKNPTCKEKGEKLCTCIICGETKKEEIPALGHKWGEWKTVKEASCTVNGEKARTCTRCGEKENGVIAKLGHDISVKIESATCTEDGKKIEVCSRCDYEKVEAIKATGHVYGEWKVEKEATFNEDGVKKKTCEKCGHTVTERIPMLSESHEHNFSGKEEVVKEATCTEEGNKKVYCTEPECGEFVIETISVKDHKPGEWVVLKESTCSETGMEQKICTMCGKVTETHTIEKKAHTYDEWKEVIAATCVEAGKEEAVCTVCEEDVEREIEPIGHDFVKWEVSKKATCTEVGEEVSTCSRCDEISARVIEATGHKFGEWEITKEPTFDEEGEKQQICSECGVSVKETIPKLTDIQPENPDKPNKPEKPENSESDVPQTADTTSVVTWVIFMVGAIACIVALRKRKTM